MKAIKFTDLELESMIDMYNAELEEAQIYIAHIQEILKKLGVEPVKAEVAEKPKQGKKRGRKPSLKPMEVKEPKKRGRKAKVVPTQSEVSAADDKPAAEVKLKAEPTGVPAKSAPEKVITASKKEVKKAAKAKVEKKSGVKPEPQVAAKVESVVTSLLNKAPKKVVKKVAKKKSAEKQRMDEMAASAKISKPADRKTPRVKVAAETPPVAPIEPIEQV